MILLVFLSIITVVYTTSIPKITVYPCSVPVSDELFTVCCKTENIYTSPTTLYKNTLQNVVAKVKHPCYITSSRGIRSWDCSLFNHTKVIQITTTKNASDSLGLWGCYFYGGSATYSLTKAEVVTNDGGYHYVEVHHNTTLTWNISGNTYNIILPNGNLLSTSNVNYSVEFTKGRVTLVLTNVTEAMNGTYVCITKNNKQKNALTLIVLASRTMPSISSISVDFTGQFMNANLTCATNSLSAGPVYYIPQFNVSWLYSTTSSYSLQEEGPFLIIKNVDCNEKFSRPVFCRVKEGPGEWSPLGYLHPHSLCSARPTMAPSVQQEGKTDQTAGIIVGSIFAGLSVVSLWLIYYCIYRRRRHGSGGCESIKDSCGDCCDSLGECCKETCEIFRRKCCCKRCRNDEDNDEPSIQDIPAALRRTVNVNDDDLQHILNLYSISDSTETSNEVPEIYTGDTDNNLNMAFDTDEVTVVNNTNIQSESSDVMCELGQANGATGVNHPALVLELETCLQDLSKQINSSENRVQVRRSHIVEDMLNIYTDPQILRSRLHVTFIGESGSDWGGVSRDVFTTFWNEAVTTFFHGDSVYVPYLALVNMENESKFLVLGRILAHSTAILGFLPVQISKSVIMVMIYNSTEIEENSLIEDFLLYLDAKDRQLITNALENFSNLSEEHKHDIQEMFFRYDMGCVLRPDSIRNHLLKIARNELCVKPRALCEKMRQGIPEEHFHVFWCHLTVDHIDLLHARLKPSAEKVLNCIQPSEPFGSLTRRRRRVYEFFQKYIDTLSYDDLKLLLQLITGQSCVPKRTIKVEFSELRGIQRRPVFHTCSYMVELPDTYREYDEFEKEINSTIHSDVLQFDIA